MAFSLNPRQRVVAVVVGAATAVTAAFAAGRAPDEPTPEPSPERINQSQAVEDSTPATTPSPTPTPVASTPTNIPTGIVQGTAAAPKDKDLTFGTYHPDCGGETVELQGTDGVLFTVSVIPGMHLDGDTGVVDPSNDHLSVSARSVDGSIDPGSVQYPGVQVQAWGNPTIVGAASLGETTPERFQRDIELGRAQANVGPEGHGRELPGSEDFDLGSFEGEARLTVSITYDRGNGPQTASAVFDAERSVEPDGTTIGLQSFEQPVLEKTFQTGNELC